MKRLDDHPILDFDRGEKVIFYFEGKPIEGYTNETIAAALHAAGIKVFGYSPRKHRPRGFFCAIGKCSSCLMVVDGRPNVRTCMEFVRPGIHVRRQRGLEPIVKKGENDE